MHSPLESGFEFDRLLGWRSQGSRNLGRPKFKKSDLNLYISNLVFERFEEGGHVRLLKNHFICSFDIKFLCIFIFLWHNWIKK